MFNQTESTPILFLEEDRNGKRRSLAPNKSSTAKKVRGNTIQDQEALIFGWLKKTLKLDKKAAGNTLGHLPWGDGDVLLEIVRRTRPDLLDPDTALASSSPSEKVQTALDICRMHFNIQPLADAGEFVKPRPDSLLLLTFLTQMKDALKPTDQTSPQMANLKKSKSPKRSLEKNLSKLADSLKRRSLPKSKQPPSSPPRQRPASTASDVKCPFCEQTVYVAERYGQDGFWFHRKCFRCHKCQELIIGPNFANIANSYKETGINNLNSLLLANKIFPRIIQT